MAPVMKSGGMASAVKKGTAKAASLPPQSKMTAAYSVAERFYFCARVEITGASSSPAG